MNRTTVFITRMYSGLYEMMADKAWKPAGIPAVTKLVAALSRRAPVIWIVVCKTAEEAKVIGFQKRAFQIEGIQIHALPFKAFSASGRLNALLNDLQSVRSILSLLPPRDKSLFYCDRSNLHVAALLKLFFRSPVVIRLLGLYPDQKRMALRFSEKLLYPLRYGAYKIPYDLAVCTQDGSGIEYYLPKLLNRSTMRRILLNGVDYLDWEASRSALDPPIRILFVGKLIREKGVPELIEAVKAVRHHEQDFHLSIVGKGPLGPFLEQEINRSQLERHVTLLGSLEHRAVQCLYHEHDIYISLNKLGNLSNTVLEAMSANLCIMMLDRDPLTHTDDYTAAVVPEDAAVRIDRGNIVGDLVQKLCALVADPRRIETCKSNLQRFRKTFLWSWDQRIDLEIKLLNCVAAQADAALQGPRLR